MSPAGGGNIKVVVRVRPFNGREIDRGAKCIVQMKDSQTLLVPPPDYEERVKSGKGGNKDLGQKVFAFDKSYWSFDRSDAHYAGQAELHKDLGKPLLDNAFQGYNNCIFAYGQTGSGKSYSMMGYGKEAGVIPQICQDMFVRIEKMQQDKNLRCTVEVSYLEIYNERVRDLLNPATKGNLKVREHPSTGPYVEDLAKLVVSSFIDIEHLMDEGNKARTVAATNMNETSSRSHAVFTLTLTQKRIDVETKMAMEKVAKISLVDLAGSERATSTGATGARLKEGAEINRSLSTLGRVIAALADLSDGRKKKTGKGISQVPYRDSVLTWLLKDSLGGNSMTAMIAAISPADINFDETLSTLRYADSAKRIKNHAVVNEDANARMIRELKEELEALRSKLSGGSGGATEEIYAVGTPLDKQIVSLTQPDGTVKKVSKAEIAEQLSQSEKLYSDLNQTWEEKLAKTEEIHKEREAALEELGISIEKGFVGLHTPKKMPHLVNLSDDPLLAECLVYNLKPGTTTVGNVETNPGQTLEIRLNGSRILSEHCTFENIENMVTLVPKDGAAVMVNGKRIIVPKRLRSGYRVILGDFHIFRFNHPLEAKAERVEQTSLRYSIIANQMGEIEKNANTPSPRTSHERCMSRAYSEVEWDGTRPDSPLLQRSRDSDWSFARREAAYAILGSDKQIAGLTDEELNILFEDVQRARAERAGQTLDDDCDSLISCPVREKYLSNGTLDNFSFDTSLTTPSTPKQEEIEERIQEVREEMQAQLEKHKVEYQEQLKNAESANIEVEAVRKEKARVEDDLREVKAEMLRKLDEQRKEFLEHIQKLGSPNPAATEKILSLTEKELGIVKKVVYQWRASRYIQMVEAMLRTAANLKEAQVMSNEMEENVYFQFVIVEAGHDICSSYDMVMKSSSNEDDDPYLEDAAKPCVGVRVINYRNSVIHLWSLEKLQERIRVMRQIYRHTDRPGYLRRFKLRNPFTENYTPQFTHVGDVDVPLSAVFASRVQDFTLDVLSPYTTHAIGILKLSLEPSSAQARTNTLKFNVVMHELSGFAEREGTEVHAQLFVPGTSEGSGVTTTQMIQDFDEGPIRFKSVHSQSVPMFGPQNICLRVAIFARTSTMHLDKILSWDDMQEPSTRPRHESKKDRIAETQFLQEEKYDIFTKIQILEPAKNGEYLPVEVIQSSDTDVGSFQLHQGLQRRILLKLAHSSGDALPWQEVTDVRVGSVKLVDLDGNKTNFEAPTHFFPLKLLSKPTVVRNANGTSNITLVGQWDSSACSPLLDNITADRVKVKVSLEWTVTSSRLVKPMSFSRDLFLLIHSRVHPRSNSIFASLFQNIRITHSISSIFSVTIRPASVRRIGNLWRMNTRDNYVQGEEVLNNWKPRGISLIHDHYSARRRRRRLAEIESFQPLLSRVTSSYHQSQRVWKDDEVSGHEIQLLQKYIRLWQSCKDPTASLLKSIDAEPPTASSLTPLSPSTSPHLLASITLCPKHPIVLKGGYLLTLSDDSSRWVRRFVELRHPYLHVYSVPDGDEVGIVGLENARVDWRLPTAKLIGSESSTRRRSLRESTIFAVYGTDNTWLFVARSEQDKIDWIWRIDKSFIGLGRHEHH